MTKTAAIDQVDSKMSCPLQYLWVCLLILCGFIPIAIHTITLTAFQLTMVPVSWFPIVDLHELIGDSWASKLAFNFTMILVWGMLHSLFAQKKTYKVQASIFPRQTHRANYTIISGVSLMICIFGLWQPTGITAWNIEFLPFWGTCLLNAVLHGWLNSIMGVQDFDMKEFLGLTPLFLSEQEMDQKFSTRSTPKLITTGSYEIVRHPMYFPNFFWVVSPVMTLDKLLYTATFGLYLVFIGIPLEEKKLVEQFGDAYIDYQKTTAALIPSPVKFFPYAFKATLELLRIRKPQEKME
mmetsp:Transcript_14589/g.19199  ORF Transcript_14589/g.19199 Transcript_14589/m.19199 type:complete len:295 (+) Transcript_14589:169-1053(+)